MHKVRANLEIRVEGVSIQFATLVQAKQRQKLLGAEVAVENEELGKRRTSGGK